MTTTTLSPDGTTITVHIPMRLARRGGRKLIIAPEGAETASRPCPQRPDRTLIKAIARAHRWKAMLDAGTYPSIAQLAEAEQTSERYAARLLRLTLLAPDIIERILHGRLPKGTALADFMKPWPPAWAEQREKLGE